MQTRLNLERSWVIASVDRYSLKARPFDHSKYLKNTMQTLTFLTPCIGKLISSMDRGRMCAFITVEYKDLSNVLS